MNLERLPCGLFQFLKQHFAIFFSCEERQKSLKTGDEHTFPMG